MKKIYTIFAFILVIGLISSGYALFNNDGITDTLMNDVNNDPQPTNTVTNSMDQVSSDLNPISTIENILTSISSKNQTTNATYIPAKTSYLNYNQDFTDKYVPCSECGGYFALGEVTKKLPKDKLCNCNDELTVSEYLNNDDYYVYSYEEVMHYLTYGEFPDSVNERLKIHDEKIKATVSEIISHYKVVPGYTDTYVKENQDFTDKYVQCYECGKYIPLGNMTTPLSENMICNHTNRGHSIAYLNTNIWGVMDYNQVINNSNTPQSNSYPENTKFVISGMTIEQSWAFSLNAKGKIEDTDIVAYSGGLWGQDIKNEEYESITSYTVPSSTVVYDNSTNIII